MIDFFSRRYWVVVRSRPIPLVVAAALLLGSGFASAGWALADPVRAIDLIPAEYRSVIESEDKSTDLGMTGAQKAAFSTSIFTNNLQVSFLAFAAGIIGGIGTVLILLYNGILLGAVGGLATEAGGGRPFLELILAHGLLEVSCIIVSAAAGLRVGWALVSPGPRPRKDILIEQAQSAIEIVIGTAPWLVLAGVVEGFVTPSGYGLAVVVVVGVLLAVIFWTLVLTRGKAEPRAATAA